MPLGKEIGTFSAKITSIRTLEVDGDKRTLEAIVDGEVSGQMTGVFMDTATFAGTNDRGSINNKGVGYLGTESVNSEGSGTYWLTKPGEWETRGAITLSSGQTMVGEGQIKLASRTWEGKIFELE